MPSVLADRDAARAAVRELLTAARDGAGGCLVVEGPPGIGKTRLLDDATALAGSLGLGALRATGHELERDDAFGVALDLLHEVRAHLRATPALAGQDRGPPRAPPADAVAAPDAGPATRRALTALVLRLAERRPLAVVVDDAHWADTATLQWLARLARRAPTAPVAVVLAVRDGVDAERQDLLERIVEDAGGRRLRLAPLDPPRVARVLAELFGESPEAGFVAACHEVTGGNPLLLRELATEMRGRGLRPEDRHAASLETYAPAGLGRRVMRRIRELPPPAPALAFAIAVLGRAAPREAAGVMGAAVDDVARAADALVASDILRPGRPLTFAHPLVRAAVESASTPGDLAIAHQRAASILRDTGARPSRIAAHLLKSDGHGERWVVGVLRSAAAEATARGEPAVAAQLLRRAADEPPPAAERAQVTLELGAALAASGSPDAIGCLSRAYDEHESPEARVHAARLLSLAFVHTGLLREAVDVLERAIADVSGSHPELAIRLEVDLLGAALADARGGDVVRRRALPSLGAPVAAGSPPERERAALLSYVATAVGRPAREAAALARSALAGGALLKDSATGSPAPYVALHALLVADDHASARAGFERLLELARGRGTPLGEALAEAWLARVDLAAGDLAAAEARARAALAIGMEDVPTAIGLSSAVLLEVLRETGRLEEARALLAVPAVGFAFAPVFVHHAEPLAARGRLRLAEGRPADALDDLTTVGRLLTEHVFANPAFVRWRSDAARALALLGRDAEARERADEEVARATAYGAARTLGNALAGRGRIRGRDGGEEDLERAVALLTAPEARLDRAHALAALGALRRRLGRREAARAPLAGALHLASACGATALADEVRVELRIAGARPRRDQVAGVAALTPSEQRIATLAAGGRSNREIADQLVVTVKAVEWHLRNAYAKLGIHSRRELGDALAAEPDDA